MQKYGFIKMLLFLIIFLNVFSTFYLHPQENIGLKSSWVVHLDLNLLKNGVLDNPRKDYKASINSKDINNTGNGKKISNSTSSVYVTNGKQMNEIIGAGESLDYNNGAKDNQIVNNKIEEASQSNASRRSDVFELKAVSALFVDNQPMQVQLWKETGQLLKYELAWNFNIYPSVTDGTYEIINLNESERPLIDRATMFVGVQSQQRGRPLAMTFCGMKGALLYPLSCDSPALEAGNSCVFDGLRQPYCLPLRMCEKTDCKDITGPTGGCSEDPAPDCIMQRSVPKGCDLSNQECIYEACFNASIDFHQTFSNHEEGMGRSAYSILVGLIIWNTILSIIVLLLLLCLARAFTNINRLHLNTRQSYTVNKRPNNTN